MAFSPSPFQAAIFAAIAEPRGNLLIEAVAGSGKTTTIVEAAKLATGDAVFLAFNKAIATELQARLPSHFSARTFHSLCYTPVTRALKARSVTADKLQRILRGSWSPAARAKYASFATKLVGLARQVGIGCLVDDTDEAWFELVNTHNLTLEREDADLHAGILTARDLLGEANVSELVDFDDLLYRAVRDGIKLPTFDWVFVDEAQDTNAVQRALLRKLLRPGARLVAVGDPAQAIYGFRGADSTAMARLKAEFAMTTLPLSVSYRCAKTIVAEAQQYLPSIEPHAAAPDGEVNDLGFEWKHEDLGATDLLVCRTVKPLIKLGHALLRKKISCRILGRDIGEGLKALVRKLNASDVHELGSKLEAWRDREVQKAVAKGNDAHAEAVEDKADSLLTILDGFHEETDSIDSVYAALDELFTDQNHRLTLCTIHKSKGLEADRVWWLNKSLCPSRWAKQAWQQEQERNLMYVATTRAKTTLMLIEQEDNRRRAS